MKKLIGALFCALLLAFTTSCSAPKNNPKQLIRDTTWVPMFVLGTKNVKIPNGEGAPVFLHISDDYKLSGLSGVNRFFGSCALERKKLRPSECKIKCFGIGATKKAGEFSEYESKFLQALKEADTLRLSANHLELMKGRKLLIELRRIPNIDMAVKSAN